MTERQKEIARAIALGESVKGVARRLGVRPQAVRRHLTNLFDSTCTWSQPQLVGWCVAHGIVTLTELQAVYDDTEDNHAQMGTRPVRQS